MVKRWLAGFLRGLAPAVVLAGLLVTQLPVPAAAAETEEASSDAVSSDADSAFDWVRQFGSASYDWVSGMAVDTTGVYAAGWVGAWNAGQRFLRKYDLGGNELWSRDNGTCVAVGGEGVFVGDFGSLRKYDSDGREVWAVDINDDGYFYHATDISADSSGAYVGGTYWSRGSGDKCGHFVLKCDPDDGRIVWSRKLPCGPGDTGALGICATSGAVYFAVRDTNLEVVGYPDFGGRYDFLYKYDADGNQLWSRVIGLSGGYTEDVCADASGVYVTGCTSDAFISKYDADGNEVWTRVFGSEAGDRAYDISLYGGSIYVAGCTWGVFPGQVGHGGADVFVCRYDTDGDQAWVRQLGSSSEDDTAVIAVSAGGIYLGGRTRGAMPGWSSQGLDDAYVGRLAIGGILGTPGWEVMDAPLDVWGAGDSGLVSICGTSSSDVLALASSGQVIHCDGQEWDLLDAGPLLPHGESSGWVSDIWASSPSDIFVAGHADWLWEPLGIGQAAIFHYDGDNWTTLETMAGDCAFFSCLWGSNGSDVFAGSNCDYGVIGHYDGDSWTPCRTSDNASPVLDTRIWALWGTGSSDVFAAGTGHCQEVVAIYHYDGSQWSCVHSGDASAQSLSFWCLNGIWNASPSDAFAVGSGYDAETGASRGIVLHYDGTTTSLMNVGTTNQLTAVWGNSASDVYAVGTNGTILHYDGCAWTPMDSGTASNLRAIWGAGPDVFAVGDNGTILHYCSDPAVTFADHNLENAIRGATRVYSGVLHRTDLAGLTMLEDSGPPIRNLTGLEYCTNLESLNVSSGEISDLSPLSGLTRLTCLDLSGNQISDVSPLAGLTGLRDLYLDNNLISDISPLSGFTGLFRLSLDGNQISDISPLSGLTSLICLSLKHNRIADIKPLVDNPGIGVDFTGYDPDWVYLQDNPLSGVSLDACIPALLARGVQVFWDVPPEMPIAPEGDSGESAPADPAGDPTSPGTLAGDPAPAVPAHADEGLSDDATMETTPAAAGDIAVTSGGTVDSAPAPETAGPETTDLAGGSAPGEPHAPARLWLYPVAVVAGFLGVSALASFAAWLWGRTLG